jgi:D-serine deaminase-like pyridoxal phosphate-dependent protein
MPHDLRDVDLILGVGHKSIPAGFWGRGAREVGRERHPIDVFSTPLLTLDRGASDANVAALLGWLADRGLEIAPHGKTTMAPLLWRRLLDAGAWGLTLATPWQVQLARREGVARILLANELVDPVGAAWIAAELDRDPAFEFACWVDSVEGVAALAAVPGSRPIDVLVEVGAAGGRTGVRGPDAARAVADAVAAEPRLRLRGVAGYEGSYGSDRDPATVARVRSYLAELVDLHRSLDETGLLVDPLVTAGGSTWIELVAESFAPLAGRAVRVIRSGAFQAHDDVFYAGTAPGSGDGVDLVLRPALAVWARVLSRPEPEFVVLDAGKRDVGFDLGMPVALGVLGRPEAAASLASARVVALNDQHAHLSLDPSTRLEVGEVVRLGISHPCTTFDRWRLVAEVADADAAMPVVVGFVPTSF